MAELDDFGLGFYGQGTLTMRERLELGVGARVDYESKEATIDSSFDPPIAPPHSVVDDRSFANVSPQVSISYRMQPERMVSMSRLSCRISRDTLSGRSAESTTPRTKRR